MKTQAVEGLLLGPSFSAGIWIVQAVTSLFELVFTKRQNKNKKGTNF